MGNKAQRPEGLICDLQARTDGGIPEECFIAIRGEGVTQKRGRTSV